MNNSYITTLQDYLAGHEDRTKARPMEKYMKDHFRFLGIKSPELKKLMKEFITQYGLPEDSIFKETINGLWQLEEREYHYAALQLIDKNKKRLKEEDLSFLENLITTQSWWDTVDHIAPHFIGTLFLRHPHMIDNWTSKWTASENIWLKRSAILFQLKYKEKTNVEVLFRCIQQCMDSNEFFVQKAIGWALREYSKTNPEIVQHFVENHPLSPLSKREALKVIKKTSKV